MGDTLWTRSFGGNSDDEGFCGIQTSDGGYLIGGYTYSFGTYAPDSGKAYLIKTDANGDTLWTKIYGGNGNELISYIIKSNDGNYVFTGYSSSYGTNGSADVYLVKIDGNGNVLWSKTFGGNDVDGGYGCVKQTPDRGYLIAGITSSFGDVYGDMYVIKTDSMGNLQWSKTYGGINSEVASVYIVAINNTYILGNYSQSFGAGIDTSNAYAICINNLGDTLWTKVYGYDNETQFEGGLVTSDGNILLTGANQTYTGHNIGGFSVKINPANGAIISANKNSMYSCQLINTTTDGGGIIAGSVVDTSNSIFTYSACINKINSSYSIGCNETPITMRVRNTQTVIGNPATQQHNVTTQVRSTHTQVGHGGVVNKLCYTMGIEQYKANSLPINVYPNPNSGSFTINYTIDADATLYIYDAQGKQVYSVVLTAQQKSIAVNNLNLANGVYMYKVLNSGNMLHNGKLIILKQ